MKIAADIDNRTGLSGYRPRPGYILCLVLLIWSGKAQSQDLQFSQFYPNSLYFNPAFAGSSGNIRFTLNYRDQWPELSSDFVTYSASYDQPLEFVHGGVGIHVFNDNLGSGTIRKYSAAFIYSYHLRVTRDLFVFAGLQASLNQNSLNSGDLVFEDMIDPFRGVSYPTLETISGYGKIYPDFAVGFLGIYKELYGGIVIHHLAKPGISDNPIEEARLPRKYSVHVANNFYLTGSADRAGSVILTPTLLYQQQNHYQNLNYGFILSREPVSLGAWIRHDLAFSFSTVIIGLAAHYRDVSLSYSYDMIVSGAGTGIPGTGAHEISCIVGFGNVEKSNVVRAIKTPKI
ncbi:MAG: PorP/SprF family type IX secretion system membrane protein [Bacteroidales bacterium]|nr:MAG: PorP/SprF family type IX secretion system membrane protein [Bacteroidales bacterium]